MFEAILKEDYKQLPTYSTSFFPLAYLCAGRAIPEKADRGIRTLMIQDDTGYLNNHVAATFHASHYYRLVEEETPHAREMVARILRDQKSDGGWLRNMPARDRHATFDAVFTLVHEGQGNPECSRAVAKAAQWALSCRNTDGGFGHYPGSQSDADAVYFLVGTRNALARLRQDRRRDRSRRRGWKRPRVDSHSCRTVTPLRGFTGNRQSPRKSSTSTPPRDSLL